MTRAELIALAERVEGLEGPCRETDRAIGLAVSIQPAPAYTASLDAATTITDGMTEARIWTIWNEALNRCSLVERHIVRELPRFIVAASLRAHAERIGDG